MEFNPPQVQGPTFTDLAGKVTVFNSVLVFRSPSVARNEAAVLTNPKAPGCLKAQMASQASTGTTLVPPPNVSLKELPSPKGTVSLEVSGSVGLSGSVKEEVAFFTHAQFAEVISAFSSGSGTNVHTLTQRLLNVARSRL
jgi:hypothetical protein